MKFFFLAIAAAFIIAGCQPTGNGGTAAECSTDADCAKAGCSGQLCVPAGKASDIITTCEYKEEYGCLKLTSCGCNEGRCEWEQTDDYASCLEDIQKN